MTEFVLDASVAAAWYLPGQATSSATQLFRQSPRPTWRTPYCFYFELNNVLLRQERRGVLSLGATEVIGHDLRQRLGVTSEGPADDEQMALAMILARTHRISLFDGFYLLLAMELDLPLVTRDFGLATAGRQERCHVLYAGEAA